MLKLTRQRESWRERASLVVSWVLVDAMPIPWEVVHRHAGPNILVRSALLFLHFDHDRKQTKVALVWS